MADFTTNRIGQANFYAEYELQSIEQGTPIKVMMLGAGELGKEVAIEFQRYGVEVIAIDRYPNAPGMQVAHRSYSLSMLDGNALRDVIEKEKPDYIVPEVEAIATQTLVELEKEGFRVIPTANAARLTMNREGIRTLAAEKLKMNTSPYGFASTKEEFIDSVVEIGVPCVVKPIMSSSGKGQSVVKTKNDIDTARSGRSLPDTQLRLFGKPVVQGERRMRVCLAKGSTIENAREKGNKAAASIHFTLD